MEMSALGSPIEALAVDYLSIGLLPVINNMWTWVAVITAAVSLWRIKAVGVGAAKSDAYPDESSPPTVSPPPHPEEEKEAVAEPASTSVSSSTTIAPSVAPTETITRATKRKFTVYYEDERDDELASAEEADDGGDGGFGVVGGCGGAGDYWCDNWEKLMRMRMQGDDQMGGWYRYQDLTVLDGNVVRLWDGCRDKTSSLSFLGSVVM